VTGRVETQDLAAAPAEQFDEAQVVPMAAVGHVEEGPPEVVQAERLAEHVRDPGPASARAWPETIIVVQGWFAPARPEPPDPPGADRALVEWVRQPHSQTGVEQREEQPGPGPGHLSHRGSHSRP